MREKPGRGSLGMRKDGPCPLIGSILLSRSFVSWLDFMHQFRLLCSESAELAND